MSKTIYFVKGPGWKDIKKDFEYVGFTMVESKLGNMRNVPVELYGMSFQTSEAAYQSCKFRDAGIVRDMSSMNGINSKKYAYSHKDEMIPLEDEALCKAMVTVLAEKARQNDFFREELINTGDNTIVELSDNKWGAHINKDQEPKGSNLLGKCLTIVRKMILDETLVNYAGHRELFQWAGEEVKLVVFGSREFDNYERMKKILEKTEIYKRGIDVMLCGKARGADSLGERFANEKGIKIEEYPALWKEHGKSAGFVRNKEMAKNATHAIGFWDGTSTGTAHMISECKRRGVKTVEYNYTKNKVESYNI